MTTSTLTTLAVDSTVPHAEWERILAVWTLRSRRPEVDGFTTVSLAVQTQDGRSFQVVERIDNVIQTDEEHGFSLGKTFSNKDEAIRYWSQMAYAGTPRDPQGVLPGLLPTVATHVVTMGGSVFGPGGQQSYLVAAA